MRFTVCVCTYIPHKMMTVKGKIKLYEMNNVLSIKSSIFVLCNGFSRTLYITDDGQNLQEMIHLFFLNFQILLFDKVLTSQKQNLKLTKSYLSTTSVKDSFNISRPMQSAFILNN